jgi:4a-hydroxytetrahydrobiopterin dehydratase
MTPLSQRHCKPAQGDPMSEADVRRFLEQVPGWAAAAGAIEKRFDFPDYHRTMAFVNAVAWVAHTQDHHPDLSVGYSRCTVRFSTHSVGGLSINDFICAARVDALIESAA